MTTFNNRYFGSQTTCVKAPSDGGAETQMSTDDVYGSGSTNTPSRVIKGTRWAPTSLKWSYNYNHFKWHYKSVIEVMTLPDGVILSFVNIYNW